MIYLDNSATTYPKPLVVREHMQKALRELGANPGRSGYEMSVRTSQAVYRCRERAAAFFGASGPECVIFQPGCTQALNLVIKGYLQPGDHVVVSDLEHNAVMRPLKALEEKGITYTAAVTVPGDNDATMGAFRQAINPRTRLVVCTAGSNVFGIRLPVERIAALCHQYGAKICVDAAQTAGVVPINVTDGGLDYLCCAGHKGLYGPMGTGLLILRDPADPLATLVEGGTGTQSQSLLQPEDPPERYESGTINVPGIMGLYAGMGFVSRTGMENIYRSEMKKISWVYERFSRMKQVRLYTPPPAAPYYVPVLSFNIVNRPSEEVGQILAKSGLAVRCGLHCAPCAHEKMGTRGTVRVSPSVFTKPGEMEALVRRVQAIPAGEPEG